MTDTSKETPFWLLIMDEEKKQTEEIRTILRKLPERIIEDEAYWNHYIALEPLVNATLDEVAEDLQRQIYKYLEMFK